MSNQVTKQISNELAVNDLEEQRKCDFEWVHIKETQSKFIDRNEHEIHVFTTYGSHDKKNQWF